MRIDRFKNSFIFRISQDFISDQFIRTLEISVCKWKDISRQFHYIEINQQGKAMRDENDFTVTSHPLVFTQVKKQNEKENTHIHTISLSTPRNQSLRPYSSSLHSWNLLSLQQIDQSWIWFTFVPTMAPKLVLSCLYVLERSESVETIQYVRVFLEELDSRNKV